MLRQALVLIRSTSALKRWISISTPAATSHEMVDYSKWLSTTPVLKNIFQGHFNEEVFDFPEIESSEEFGEIEMMSQSVESFMTQEVDSRQIDLKAKIPTANLEVMKSLGIFGIQIPTEYGGLGLNNLRRLMISEQLSIDGSIATTVMGHESCGVHGILMAGTEDQKKKYLPMLASGEAIGAFCLTEQESGSDAQMMEATAVLSEDGTHYRLNGTKTCVINGSIANVMIVFAKTEITDDEDNTNERITAFIVERDFKGIRNGTSLNQFGCRGTDTCSITFEDTNVPVGNVLGEVGQGFKLAMHILNAGRLSVGAHSVGILKHVLKLTTDYALTRTQFKQPIGNFQLIKEKLARVATAVYAIESMTYLTAGMMDEDEDRDFSLETAALKIYSSEAVWNAVSECLQVFGGTGYVTDYPYERILRDVRYFSLHGTTNEILRLLIAGSCVKHVGLSMKEDLLKIIQPKKYLAYNLKRTSEMWNCRHESVDQNLQMKVHEDLAPIMHTLSQHTNHFRHIVPELIAKYGRNIIDEQMVLSRLTDNAIDIYGIVAVVSRATRSILRNSPTAAHERDIAYAFSKEALDRITRRNVTVSFMETSADFPEKVRIADALMKWHGYGAQHPLTRNW